ncbi:diacylglycerol/lipid kinase family protein [Loigolactobacillus zhaoyuanensis]|uniref:diacylglycerol/lipid kinase family protein n=1 Tax=Loigolactobacillus zhaoyuanensis TaxID=2486017 RepID=UPI000F73958B|nr:diacylglycerol kinase family protein [Loigolactobacillus zhaoyuanensis]
MTLQRPFYVIINNFAGGGRTRQTWLEIATSLRQRNIDYTANFTQAPGHATELAHDLALKYNSPTATPPILLVLGGDGTLHEALNGLQQVDHNTVPLAYIPCGSGNDFARGAGITTDPQKALQQILVAKRPLILDVGRCDDRQTQTTSYFSNNIGIGFDANVVHITNRSVTKKYLNKYHAGSLAYLFSLVKAFFSQKPFPVTVTTNGKQYQFKRGFVVTTTNHPYFGGGVPLLASASVYSHHLDLVIMERVNVFYFILLFALMFRQLHTKLPPVHHFHTKELRIKTTTPEYGQADGEDLDKRTFDLNFSVTSQTFWFVPNK